MTCCAADMKAIPLSIEFADDLPTLEGNTWVKAGGEMRYEHIDGVTYPVMKVERIQRARAPEGGSFYK